MNTHTTSNASEEERNGFLASYHAIDNESLPELHVEIGALKPRKVTFCFYFSIAMYVLSIMSLTIFGTLLILKLDGDITWGFSKVMIFFDISMMGFLLLGNITVIKNSQIFNNFLGKCFLVFCLNNIIVMALIFGILLSLKLKGDIDWAYSVVFIPIYFIMSIIFIFICFIIPGLVDSAVKMYKEAIIISSQYFAGLLTVILVLFKIDENLKLYYLEIFILEEISLLVLLIIQIVKFRPDNTKLLQIEDIGVILSFLTGFLVLGLKCDDFIEGAWKFVLIPFYLAYLCAVIKSYRIFNFLYQLNNS